MTHFSVLLRKALWLLDDGNDVDSNMSVALPGRLLKQMEMCLNKDGRLRGGVSVRRRITSLCGQKNCSPREMEPSAEWSHGHG